MQKRGKNMLRHITAATFTISSAKVAKIIKTERFLYYFYLLLYKIFTNTKQSRCREDFSATALLYCHLPIINSASSKSSG